MCLGVFVMRQAADAVSAELHCTFDQIARRIKHMARTGYWLTPPTRLTLIVSLVLVILALLVHYAHVSIPVVGAHVFETLLIGYLVLLVGNLFRGL